MQQRQALISLEEKMLCKQPQQSMNGQMRSKSQGSSP